MPTYLEQWSLGDVAGTKNRHNLGDGANIDKLRSSSVQHTPFDTLLAPLDSWDSETYSLAFPICPDKGDHDSDSDSKSEDSDTSSKRDKKAGVFIFQHKALETAVSVDKPQHSPRVDGTPVMWRDDSAYTGQLSNSQDPGSGANSSNVPHRRRSVSPPSPTSPLAPHELKWNWELEHADRKREAKADHVLHGAAPFQVDRRVLKDVVLEKMGTEVARISFLSSVDGVELVARVARRFMPRLKIESEVATMQYIRENTNIPVPVIYHYDANPYNRLGGEYILMSKAAGIPLSKVFHGLSYTELVKLTNNLAGLVIPLFAHRFDAIGSLYFGPNPRSAPATLTAGDASAAVTPSAITPKGAQPQYSSFPFTQPVQPKAKLFTSLLLPLGHELTPTTSGLTTPVPFTRHNSVQSTATVRPHGNSANSSARGFHVGPIISWPFFGSNRGDLTHPTEINRGPWPSSHEYFEACKQREITGVLLENEGRTAPHRLHLDPDEIQSSRHHHLKAVPGDESDDSDEYDLEESEEEWEGPGDTMYCDYRRMQRSTFLVAHLKAREDAVRKEMTRWMKLMERLDRTAHHHSKKEGDTSSDGASAEEFTLDLHDLSLENVFVDAKDRTKITCVIDWESTTTRPLWQSAHLPACLQSSPFTANLFRKAVADIASGPTSPPIPSQLASSPSANIKSISLPALAQLWLHHESVGTRLRMCHRFAEWDGWEEGLADCMLGSEDHEEEWFHDPEESSKDTGLCRGAKHNHPHEHEHDHCLVSPPVEGLASPEPDEASIPVGLSTVFKRSGLRNLVEPKNGMNGSSTTSSSLTSSHPPPAAAQQAPSGRLNGQTAIPSGAPDALGQKRKVSKLKLPFDKEKEKEQVLAGTGDICGGRGGELGRRLEAWLTVTGQVDGHGHKQLEVATASR